MIAAVQFARERELLIAVRGGGHSVGGLSTCDDGIVIDLSGMRGVRVDPEGRRARANGGAHLAELDREAQTFGLVCPVGVVGHTGVAGLTLGGGMGRLMRRFGLTIDNLLSVDVVTADGRLVRASEDVNPDLFWGIRGAGANFGVVTSFEFRLHQMGTLVTNGLLAFPVERAREVVAAFDEFALGAPDEVMTTMGFLRASADLDVPGDMIGRPAVFIGVTYAGPADEAETALKPLRDLRPVADSIAAKPYVELQAAADEENVWGKRFYMKGGMLATPVGEALDVFMEQAERAPYPGCDQVMWTFGGAVARVPDDATAFSGRDARHWLGIEAAWTDPAEDDARITWARESMDALGPFTTGRSYVNDIVDSDDAAARAAYGGAKYEQLVALKRVWDPDNAFRLNQNIKP